MNQGGGGGGGAQSSEAEHVVRREGEERSTSRPLYKKSQFVLFWRFFLDPDSWRI
jgi:hypothetical protein